MSGPYGQDGEFVFVVGVVFFLFMVIGAVVEFYMEAKKDDT
tara:strand:+ start:1002 stop:1124 length:123 start_codon:yes stop_codon:yes gene_type:complete